MCMCNFACKGHLRNDLYCVRRDVKPYSLTHSLFVLCEDIVLCEDTVCLCCQFGRCSVL